MFDSITEDVRARLSARAGALVGGDPKGDPKKEERGARPVDRAVLIAVLLIGAGLLAFTWFRSGRSVETDVVELQNESTADRDGSWSTEADRARDGTVPESLAPEEVRVHVAGAVVAPGVHALHAGARGQDALDAAGGALPDADLARINLAAEVADGQQLYVPRAGEAVPEPHAAGGGPAAGPVNINTASLEELDTLPGVGESTARKIIDHREQNGPFTSVDDLLDVSGIGERKLEELAELVTV